MFADRSGPGDFLVGEAGKSFQFSCWILQPIGIAKLGYPLFLSHVLLTQCDLHGAQITQVFAPTIIRNLGISLS